MSDCRYCEQTFEEETAIREHLYEAHERDELSDVEAFSTDEITRGVKKSCTSFCST